MRQGTPPSLKAMHVFSGHVWGHRGLMAVGQGRPRCPVPPLPLGELGEQAREELR
jgi:hypothetical protein